MCSGTPAASEMVNRGASFKDVADVLGHQSLQTTGIYAKLDLATLSDVALPWMEIPNESKCFTCTARRYISIREALGFQMRAERTLLRDFVNFVESHGVGIPIRAYLASNGPVPSLPGEV